MDYETDETVVGMDQEPTVEETEMPQEIPETEDSGEENMGDTPEESSSQEEQTPPGIITQNNHFTGI